MNIKKLYIKSKKLAQMVVRGDFVKIINKLNEKKELKISDSENYKNFLLNRRKLENIACGNEQFKLGIIDWNEINTNAADLKSLIEEADWEYVGFSYSGDKFDDNFYPAVQSTLKKCKEKGDSKKLIYFDYDEADGENLYPHFLPDFCPDWLLSQDYIKGNFIVEREYLISIIDRLSGRYAFFEYQILLNALNDFVLSKEKCFYHIKDVLCHRIKKQQKFLISKEQLEQMAEIKEKIFGSERFKVFASSDYRTCSNHLYYIPKEFPLVSIIIPSKDNPSLLKVCINSIEKYTSFTPYEIIVVDNGSSDSNKAKYEQLVSGFKGKIKYVYKKQKFNFSTMCNIGADNASGELLLFLNDDMEVAGNNYDMNIDYLGVLSSQALQPHVGAVGAKLYFPDSNIIQHTGIINCELDTLHLFTHQPDVLDELKSDRSFVDGNFIAVTGACLMITRDKFNAVKGFREELAVTYNDIDLCMSLIEMDLYNVVRTDVVLYHHESISRGEDGFDEEKFLRHLVEREKLFEKHPFFVKSDPFYSPYLSQKKSDYSVNSQCYVNQISENYEVKAGDIIQSYDFNIVGKIHMAVCLDNLQIRGFAYADNKKINKKLKPCIVVLNDGVKKVFKAMPLYDASITSLEKTNYNIDFASFYCCIDYAGAYNEDSFKEVYIGMYDRQGKVYLSNIKRKIEVK